MAANAIHHIGIGVRNGLETLRNFTHKFSFQLVARRKTPECQQWVIRAGAATFLITEPSESVRGERHGTAGLRKSDNCTSLNDYPFHDWRSQFCNSQSSENKQKDFIDSVYNIAFVVDNVDACAKRVETHGGEILQSPRTVKDKHGGVCMATVRSCVGNVIHTLVERSDYKGVFLPGFDPLNTHNDVLYSGQSGVKLTHFDHVTYACPKDSSHNILDWYERCFGMERFLINSEEDLDEGFLVQGQDVGMRLTAMEYWKCAETGLALQPKSDSSIKIVIAEPLPGQGPNQVETFLGEHQGAGIQHIGLYTPDIITAVESLKQAGADFLDPPQAYYSKVGKLQEIQSIGLPVDSLRHLGILLDAEADAEVDSPEEDSTSRYLMQVFTQPIFREKTFFLEIIQRCGATGFGAGNITALWRSVQAYLDSR